MVRLHFVLTLGLGMVFWLVAANSPGQQTNVSTPASGVGHSFYEHIGSSWGLRGPGWFFNFGGGGTTPQFGGYNPNAGANLGFGFNQGGLSGGFNFYASQGSTRSAFSGSPSVTVMNGAQGFISDTSLSPFVIGFIPVVGASSPPAFVSPAIAPAAYMGMTSSASTPARDYLEAVRRAKAHRDQAVAENFRNEPVLPDLAGPAADVRPKKAADREAGENPGPAVGAALSGVPAGGRLDAAQGSSAGRAAMSVADARAALAAEQAAQREEALVWLERARGAEEAGKANVAAIYYRMVADRATGEIRQQALDRLAALKAGGDGQR